MRRKTPQIPLPPLTLADSWLDGFCESAAAAFAVKRTQDELKAAGITEAQARAIRAELQEVFERWRKENPRVGEAPRGGLLGDYFAETHPFESYAAFLSELHGDRYPPLTVISEKHGMTLPATLLLAEAAAGRFESARRVREDMDSVLLEIERGRTRALDDILKTVLPVAEIGWKVKGGPSKRKHQKDKQNFIALVRAYRGAISTVADVRRHPELKFLVADRQVETVRGWLKEAGIELKPGRPKKN